MSAAPIQESFIGYLPPPGTPNPSFPPDLENKVPRERIYLPAQDGQTCFFAAMDRIRLIMGDHPSVAENEMRKREIVLLNYRERFNAIVTQNIEDQQLAAQMRSFCNSASITREIAKSFIHQNENNPRVEHPEIFDTLREFTDQEEIEELSEFFSQKYLEKITEYTKQLMRDVSDNLDGIQLYDTSKFSFIEDFRESGFSTNDIALFITELKNQPLYSRAGLWESYWHPQEPISSLIAEIQKNGPLLVIGQFGKSYYNEDPLELSQKIMTKAGDDVHERSLWGWPPNSTRNDDPTLRHAVLIIGASEKNKHIYFIDPLDPSDPNDPESQKIYVMSERRFLSNLCPLSGFQMRDEAGDPIFNKPHPEGGPNQYALHGDPNLFYL